MQNIISPEEEGRNQAKMDGLQGEAFRAPLRVNEGRDTFQSMSGVMPSKAVTEISLPINSPDRTSFAPQGEGESVSVSDSIMTLQTPSGDPNMVGGNPEPKKGKSVLKITALVTAIVTVLGGLGVLGAWGYTKYERVYVALPAQKLLPQDVDFTATVAIKEDAKQVQILSALVKKFPGYEYLRKEMDKTGEGKDADQSFLDAWRATGVSFQDEVLPALGESAYVVIPDLHPVEQVVGQEVGSNFSDSPIRSLALGAPSANDVDMRVLGDSTRARTLQAEANSPALPALDFILVAPIVDNQKALAVMEKIGKKEESRYQVTVHTYKGYTYLEMFDTEFEAKAKGSEDMLRLNVSRTFHSLLGSNWVSVSRDDWMKETIDRRESNTLLSFSEELPSLAGNEKYQSVMQSLHADGDNLLSVYYRWDMQNSCGESDFCAYGIKDEGIREGGVSIQLSEEGILVRSSAPMEGKEFKQNPNGYREGFAKSIVKNANGRWADMFFEVPDARSAYYDFKRNTLTDKGLSQWAEGLEEVSSEVGFHIERDLIDRLTGGVGFVLYTDKKAFPDGAMLFEMKEGEAFMRGLFTFLAQKQNEQLQYMSGFQDPLTNSPLPVQSKKAPARIPEFSLEEKTIGTGTLFHLKMDDPSGSLATALEASPYEVCGVVRSGSNPVAVIAGSCPMAEQILSGSGGASQTALSADEEYGLSEKYVGEKGHSRSHIVPLGLFYAVYGAWSMLAGSYETGDTTYGDDSLGGGANKDAQTEMESMMTGVEGIVKTVASVTTQNETMHSGTVFIHIKELPSEEKDRASAGIEAMMSQMSQSRKGAESAMFKSKITSLVPQMIICCDESGATLGSVAGQGVCDNADAGGGVLPTAKTLGVDVVSYTVQKNCDANGDFEYLVSMASAGSCSGTTKITADGAKFPAGC